MSHKPIAMSESDLPPAISPAVVDAPWMPDGHGNAVSGEFTISLDPQTPGRWYIARADSGERLWQGAVLDTDDGHRESYSLTARLEADGIPAEGLDEWGPWAEAEASRALRAEMTQAVRNAEVKIADAKDAVERAEEVTPRGSFADRVTTTQVDLVTLMQGDLAPPPPIKGSGGVLLQGVAHLWPMERKGGKSIATLRTAVDIALAGGRVAVLDRENGKNRYALRLKDIAGAMELSAAQLEEIRERLPYFAYPRIQRGDEEELVELFHEMDLVVYDSSRTFMASQGLKENSSDDYTDFMVSTVEPLKEAGVATLILDNSGWSDSGRPRGTSSKEDLNEQLFISEKRKDFTRTETGEILLEIKESRDGLSGAWTMTIGGGAYEAWQPAPEGMKVAGGGRGGKQKAGKDQRLVVMRELLADDPTMTDDDLATALGVHAETVRRYRKDRPGN